MELSSGEKKYKYIIRYSDECKIESFNIILPKTSAYIKCYNSVETKSMYFLIADEDFLKKYNDIWDEVSKSMKKDLIANLPTIKNF